VLQLLSKAAVQTVNEPEFKERLIAQGFDPKGSSPEEFSAFIQSESTRWAAIIKAMKVKIE
jgi:tripartite-type tricarboxylate transporter receptor subunit TctC